MHWRAPLKVIIGYDWSEEEKTSAAKKVWAQNKILKLLQMLQSVNASFPENPNTDRSLRVTALNLRNILQYQLVIPLPL